MRCHLDVVQAAVATVAAVREAAGNAVATATAALVAVVQATVA